MFSVGDKIVHPMHGAGIIQGIEEKKILGQVKQYYVLKLSYNDMNVMIPVDAEASVGMRLTVERVIIDKVIKVLSQDSSEMDSNWNRRCRDNMDKLKTGDILQVAEVVRNLMRVDREKGLSAGEKKMLLTARQILISEIILSCDLSEGKAVELVENAV